MWFNSFSFIAFFAVVCVVHGVLGHRLRNLWLLGCSYFFYGCWDWRFLGLIVFTTTFEFVCEPGALSLCGRRVPASLKVFLLTLATLDDLGAIIIIALFYTSSISFIGLSLAAACLVVLVVMNRLKVDRLGAYLIIGFVMWVCVLESGVHAAQARTR